MNELMIHSITHDHEGRKPARFDRIDPAEVRAIGGYAVNGRAWPPLRRLKVFDEYFEDAVRAGKAAPEERQLLLSVFRLTARTKPGNAGAWLRKVWSNRQVRAPSLTRDDRDYAARLLQDCEVTP